MVQVVIGVGSNIEREKNICSALDQLQVVFGELLISPVYQSDAESSQNTFHENEMVYYNLVVAVETENDMDEVKSILKTIELSQNRQRHVDTVTIDLDLLLYGNYVGELDDNAIPHHDITERAYALRPLSDLLPKLQHPVYEKSFSRLWDEFKGDKQLRSVDFIWRDRLLSAAVCLPLL